MSETKSASQRWMERLGSPTVGVVLMIVVAAVSAVGTLVVQCGPDGADPAAVQAYYGKAWPLLSALGLTDLFHSTWYLSLLGLLALNVLAATIARFSLRAAKLGMMLAHAGVLLALFGGFVYFLHGDKGVVSFQEGDTADKYLSRRDGAYKPLPFTVHLNRFTVERYPTALLIGPHDNAVSVKPEIGRELTVPWTSARVTFEKLIPNAERVVEVKESAGAPRNPAACFQLETESGVTTLWRFAKRESPADMLLRSDGRVAVGFDNEATIRDNDIPAEPRAYAVNRETGRSVEIPARAGESFPLPGTTPPATGEILRIADDIDNTSRGPGLFIQVHSDGKTGMRRAYARFPFFNPEAHAGLSVILPEIDFIYWRPKVILSVLEKGAPGTFDLRWWAGARWETLPIQPKTAVATGGAIILTLLDVVEHARVDERYEPSKTPTGVDAALVKVEWPAGPPVRLWLATAEPDRAVRASGLLVLAYVPSPDVREYRSEVVLDDNVSGASVEGITVNHPACRRGWQLFQEAGNADVSPALSRLAVKRDPGLWFVYVGLILLTLGVFWASFTKTKVERK